MGTRNRTGEAVVFGDIHGNIAALEAVIEDIADRGLTGDRYCLGDLVGYGTAPNEVVAFFRERDIPTLQGNYDRGVGANSEDCGCAYQTEAARQLGAASIAWTNDAITPENRAFLADLPAHIEFELGDLTVLLVHGSPRRVNEYLFEDRPAETFERLLDTAGTEVLICGHTHIPYHRSLESGRHVVNAGSVGKPKDGDPRACYAVLRADGTDLDVSFHRVEYDVERAATAIEESEMPDEFAAMLRTGDG